MARGVLGAAYSVDKNAYNKGVADELNLQALQRANTARRMITSNNNYGVTQPDAYQNPFDSPIQEQGRVMPDPMAGGQYMTVPGSEQDKMLTAQDGNFLPPQAINQAQTDKYEADIKRNVGLLNQSNLANARNAYSNDPNFFTPNFDPSTITVKDSTRFPVKRPNIQNITDNIYEVASSGGQKIYRVGPGATIGGKQFKKTKITSSNIDAVNEFINLSNKQSKFRGDNTVYTTDNTAGKEGQALLDALEGVPYTPEVAEQMANIQTSMQGSVLDRNADDIADSFGINRNVGGGDEKPEPTEETTEEVIVNNTGKKVTLDKTNLPELLESSNDFEPRDAEIKDKTNMGVIIRMREDQVNKPSKGLGQVARDMIEDRKFITNKIMRNQRLAEVYRRVGDATNYQAALTASDSLRQELREYDNAITLAIGKDALADLNYSNNASRVSQVLSRILNRNIEIVPNSYDNKFTMLVDGQVREQGLSKAQMSDRVNSLTDSGYRQQKIKTRMEQAKMLFQGNIDKDKELTVLLGNIKLETLKGKVQAMIERIKADNTLNIKAFNDGTAILQTGPGQFMFFNPFSPDPLNEGGTMPMFKSLSMPYTNTQVNPYKQGFNKPE